MEWSASSAPRFSSGSKENLHTSSVSGAFGFFLRAVDIANSMIILLGPFLVPNRVAKDLVRWQWYDLQHGCICL